MIYKQIAMEHDGKRYMKPVPIVATFSYDGFDFFIFRTKNGYIGTEVTTGFATTLDLSKKKGNTYCGSKEEAQNRTIKNIEHAKSKGKTMKSLTDKALKQWLALPKRTSLYVELKKLNKV